DFEQRAVCRRRIVEVDVRGNGHLGRSCPPGTLPALQQRLERSLSAEHILEALPEARDFTGIQFERAVQIREIKGVQNDARGVRKGIGFVDVHSPAREYSRNRGEQRGAVGGEQRQDKTVSRRGHLRLDRFLAEFAVQPKV